jgi:hypothetical protein
LIPPSEFSSDLLSMIANVERIALFGRAAPGWLEPLQQLLGL